MSSNASDNDSKRPAAASSFSASARKWSRWATGFFKRDKPLGSEPWFNPESVTEQKREWLEQQRTFYNAAAAWPEHIFESFYVLGLPPDMELTQVAEQLCGLERKQRHHHEGDLQSDLGKDYLQPPQPCFAPQVLYRYPGEGAAPISDDEVAALAFPEGVAPEKLRRTLSLSALDELVMGRDSDQQQQCFVFMLKVGGNFPLYGCCWYVCEMLHRPPYLASQRYRSCRAPFRQCMIAAPRCYCLLSHYPFFDLHFRVLKIVLDLERLERLLEYDSEKSKLPAPVPVLTQQLPARTSRRSIAGQQLHAHSQHDDATGSSSAPVTPSGRSTLSTPVAAAAIDGAAGDLQAQLAHSRVSAAASSATESPAATAPDSSAAVAADGATAEQPRPQQPESTEDATAAAQHVHTRRVNGPVVHGKERYCQECAAIIADMCPFTPGASPLPENVPAQQQQPQPQHQQQQLQQDSKQLEQREQQAVQHQDHVKIGKGAAAQQQHQHEHDTVQGSKQQQRVQQALQQQQQLDQEQKQQLGPVQQPKPQQPDPGQPEQHQQDQAAAKDPVYHNQHLQKRNELSIKLQPEPQQKSNLQQHCTTPGYCEVCGKSLSMAESKQQDSSAAPAKAASAAADGSATDMAGQSDNTPHTRGLSFISSVLARVASDMGLNKVTTQDVETIAAGSETSSAGPLEDGDMNSKPQQQQQQSAPGNATKPGAVGFAAAKAWVTTVGAADGAAAGIQEPGSPQSDATAAAVSDADGAASTIGNGAPYGTGTGAASGSGGDTDAAAERDGSWVDWQGIVAGVKGASRHQMPSVESQQLDKHGTLAIADSQQEASIVQRMWEVWAPKSPHSPSVGRTSGGLSGFLRRPSRNSLTSPSQSSPHQQQQSVSQVLQQHEQLKQLRQQYLQREQQQAVQVVPEEPVLEQQQREQQQQQPSQLGPLQLPSPQWQQQPRRLSDEQWHRITSDQRQQQQQQQAQQQQRSQLQQNTQEEPLQRGFSFTPLAVGALAGVNGPAEHEQQQHLQLQQQDLQQQQQEATQSQQQLQLPERQQSLQQNMYTLVSAFAAIAASAEPFSSSASPSPLPPVVGDGGDSPVATARRAYQAKPHAAIEAAATAAAGVDGKQSSVHIQKANGMYSAPVSRSNSLSGSSPSNQQQATLNVTIGGAIPTAGDTDVHEKVQLQETEQLQGSSTIARTLSGRKGQLFEEVALRRSGDMSAELRNTISHLVQIDSCSLLEAYHSSPVPLPGDMYRLMLGDMYRLEFERMLPSQQYIPPGRNKLQQEVLAYAEVECAQQLQLWTVAAVCRSLSLDNIVTLLNAALLEKQVVVFCPEIGTLAAVVLALVPMLRPFSWQSLMLPVTPRSMMAFLEAPVPFVLGVQYKTPDVATRCHGLMRVNVYKDGVKNASFPALPNARQLLQSLTPHYTALHDAAPLAIERPVHVITPDEERAAQKLLTAMHEYLTSVCGDLRLHTIVNVGMSKRTGVFMRDSLIESMPAKDRPFMRAFTETQMFAAYADGVVSDYCEF